MVNVKKIFFIILLTLVQLFSSPDFNESLHKNFNKKHYKYFQDIFEKNNFELPYWRLCSGDIDLCKFKKFFIDLYEKNRPDKVLKTQNSLKIPKIIHQIWIGPKPFPENSKRWAESWKKMLPDWDYILWDNEMIDNLNLENADLIAESNNFGEKSDIVRYEILNKFGGVYLDVDCECVDPDSFRMFHENYDMYVGFQPLDVLYFGLGIGVIGSCANHPVLRACISGIRKNFENKVDWIIEKTGPVFFTKMFYKYCDQLGFKDIAFPPTYFYCFGPTDKTDLEYYDENILKQFARPETCVMHYYSGSWS